MQYAEQSARSATPQLPVSCNKVDTSWPGQSLFYYLTSYVPRVPRYSTEYLAYIEPAPVVRSMPDTGRTGSVSSFPRPHLDHNVGRQAGTSKLRT